MEYELDFPIKKHTELVPSIAKVLDDETIINELKVIKYSYPPYLGIEYPAAKLQHIVWK